MKNLDNGAIIESIKEAFRMIIDFDSNNGDNPRVQKQALHGLDLAGELGKRESFKGIRDEKS